MTPCITTRSRKPLLLLVRVENWLAQWLREALDMRQDTEVRDLLTARQELCRALSALLQSDLYGGPLKPGTRRFMRGFDLLRRVDDSLTLKLTEARARGSSESGEIWAARRTIRSLMSEVIESWEKSGHPRA